MVEVCCCAVLVFGELACRLAAIVACYGAKKTRESRDNEGKGSESSRDKSQAQNITEISGKSNEPLLWSKDNCAHYVNHPHITT